MDGKVVIGTELNESEIDKQLNELPDKIRKKLLKAGKTEDFEKSIKNLSQNVENEVNKIVEEMSPLTEELDDLVNQYRELTNRSNFISFKSDKKEAEELKQQIKDIIKQVEKLTGEKIIINGFDNAKKNADKMKFSIKDIIKNIGKWALALFGIRTAYNFIRQSVSTLSQYDDQMAINIQYIRYLLASTLKPLIENIIQLVYKMLAYINYIASAWFHVNLFANASTEAFEKQNKALGGSVAKAKELQKTLSGFDEMNVLQENGDVSSGGGGGGVSLPNFEAMEDVPIPSWLEFIKNNKDTILATLTGIATALTLIKTGISNIKAIGIGAIVAGVIMLIQDIIDLIKDPSWQNFVAVLGDIAVVIGGIMLVMGNWWGLLVSLVGLAVKLIAENWDTIKGILGQIGGWIYDHIIKPVGDFFKGLIDKIHEKLVNLNNFIIDICVKIHDTWNNAWNNLKDVFNNIFEGIFSIVKDIFDKIYNKIKEIIDKIKNLFVELWNKFTGTIGKIVTGLKDVANQVKETIGKINSNVVGGISSKISSGIKNLFGFAKGGIVVPKLASGGIINQPGRGVPISSAIGGERGMEGVIPLTDSQQMELLGEAIGRYITINANITNTMNGRVISRELQKVQNDSDFAFNR